MATSNDFQHIERILYPKKDAADACVTAAKFGLTIGSFLFLHLFLRTKMR